MSSLALAFDIVARDKASATFDKVGKSSGKLKSHLGNLSKGVKGDFTGLLDSLKNGVSTIGPWGAAAGAALGGLTAVAGTAGKIAEESIDAFKGVAGETLKLQRVMGGTAEDASRFRFAFHETGVDADGAAKAIGILSKNLVNMGPKTKTVTQHVQVATGAWKKQTTIVKDAAGHFQKLEKMVPVTKLKTLTQTVKVANPTLAALGINARDAHGKIKPMADLLPQIADKFKAMPNGAEKSAAALKLFGKGGIALLPFLNRGSAGIKELTEKSDKFGLTLSGKDLDALKKSREAHKDWDAAMEGAKVRIGAQLLPMVTKLVVYFQEKMIPIIVKAGEWVQRHGDDIQRWATIIGTAIAAGVKAWLLFEGVVAKVFGTAGKIIAFFILNALSPMLSMWAAMLRALSHVPGFGWAKDAADKIDNAAKKARDFANALTAIPKNTTVTVNSYYKTHGTPVVPASQFGSGAGYKGRASGGPVRAGVPYIVGEHEPELFVPNQSGRIYNQKQMGMGGVSVTQQFYGITDAQEAAAAAVSRLNHKLRVPS